MIKNRPLAPTVDNDRLEAMKDLNAEIEDGLRDIYGDKVSYSLIVIPNEDVDRADYLGNYPSAYAPEVLRKVADRLSGV